MDGSNMRGAKVIEISAEFLRQQTDAGVTGKEIAAMVGCNPKTVYARMREHGITPAVRLRKAIGSRRVDRELIRKLWMQGLRAEDIAERAACARDTVRHIAAELALPKRNPSEMQPMQKPRVRAPTADDAPVVVPTLATEIAASSARVDAEIMRSKGQYCVLAEIEARHGLRRGQALARWHVLRAG